MDRIVTFEEVLIGEINLEEMLFEETGSPTHEIIKEMLYFVRNVGDVMNLNLKDDDFRRIIGTFYTDMINNVMKEE